MSQDRTAALAAFWNARYAGDEYAYGTAPNDFLVAQVALLPVGQPVLCLADGEGRNGVWLASRGFDVTSIDVAQQGLDKAQALAKRAGVSLQTLRADVTRHELGENRWGAIVSIFLHLPRRARALLLGRCVPSRPAASSSSRPTASARSNSARAVRPSPSCSFASKTSSRSSQAWRSCTASTACAPCTKAGTITVMRTWCRWWRAAARSRSTGRRAVGAVASRHPGSASIAQRSPRQAEHTG